MELSIVIPVYNSFNILDELVKNIKLNVNFVKEYELVLVNDCSPDNSWGKIEELIKENSFIKGVNLRKNSSQHNAVMAGLNQTSGKVIIMMDDDLQHSPKYIENLYAQIVSGFDVCYTKFPDVKQKTWKRLGSKFNDKIANILLKKPKNLYLSSFKGISKAIRDEIIGYNGPYPYVDGLLLSVTNSITTIEVEHKSRFEGEGNYNLINSVSLWLKMVTSFSILPLRVATFIGIIFSFISFITGMYYVVMKLAGNAAPEGWTSLMVVVLFLGGIQLISIGIIGEYIGRSYLRLNKKAQYVIKEVK